MEDYRRYELVAQALSYASRLNNYDQARQYYFLYPSDRKGRGRATAVTNNTGIGSNNANSSIPIPRYKLKNVSLDDREVVALTGLSYRELCALRTTSCCVSCIVVDSKRDIDDVRATLGNITTAGTPISATSARSREALLNPATVGAINRAGIFGKENPITAKIEKAKPPAVLSSLQSQTSLKQVATALNQVQLTLTAHSSNGKYDSSDSKKKFGNGDKQHEEGECVVLISMFGICGYIAPHFALFTDPDDAMTNENTKIKDVETIYKLILDKLNSYYDAKCQYYEDQLQKSSRAVLQPNASDGIADRKPYTELEKRIVEHGEPSYFVQKNILELIFSQVLTTLRKRIKIHEAALRAFARGPGGELYEATTTTRAMKSKENQIADKATINTQHSNNNNVITHNPGPKNTIALINSAEICNKKNNSLFTMPPNASESIQLSSGRYYCPTSMRRMSLSQGRVGANGETDYDDMNKIVKVLIEEGRNKSAEGNTKIGLLPYDIETRATFEDNILISKQSQNRRKLNRRSSFFVESKGSWLSSLQQGSKTETLDDMNKKISLQISQMQPGQQQKLPQSQLQQKHGFTLFPRSQVIPANGYFGSVSAATNLSDESNENKSSISCSNLLSMNRGLGGHSQDFKINNSKAKDNSSQTVNGRSSSVVNMITSSLVYSTSNQQNPTITPVQWRPTTSMHKLSSIIASKTSSSKELNGLAEINQNTATNISANSETYSTTNSYIDEASRIVHVGLKFQTPEEIEKKKKQRAKSGPSKEKTLFQQQNDEIDYDISSLSDSLLNTDMSSISAINPTNLRSSMKSDRRKQIGSGANRFEEESSNNYSHNIYKNAVPNTRRQNATGEDSTTNLNYWMDDQDAANSVNRRKLFSLSHKRSNQGTETAVQRKRSNSYNAAISSSNDRAVSASAADNPIGIEGNTGIRKVVVKKRTVKKTAANPFSLVNDNTAHSSRSMEVEPIITLQHPTEISEKTNSSTNKIFLRQQSLPQESKLGDGHRFSLSMERKNNNQQLVSRVLSPQKKNSQYAEFYSLLNENHNYINNIKSDVLNKRNSSAYNTVKASGTIKINTDSANINVNSEKKEKNRSINTGTETRKSISGFAKFPIGTNSKNLTIDKGTVSIPAQIPQQHLTRRSMSGNQKILASSSSNNFAKLEASITTLVGKKDILLENIDNENKAVALLDLRREKALTDMFTSAKRGASAPMINNIERQQTALITPKKNDAIQNFKDFLGKPQPLNITDVTNDATILPLIQQKINPKEKKKEVKIKSDEEKIYYHEKRRLYFERISEERRSFKEYIHSLFGETTENNITKLIESQYTKREEIPYHYKVSMIYQGIQQLLNQTRTLKTELEEFIDWCDLYSSNNDNKLTEMKDKRKIYDFATDYEAYYLAIIICVQDLENLFEITYNRQYNIYLFQSSKRNEIMSMQYHSYFTSFSIRLGSLVGSYLSMNIFHPWNIFFYEDWDEEIDGPKPAVCSDPRPGYWNEAISVLAFLISWISIFVVYRMKYI